MEGQDLDLWHGEPLWACLQVLSRFKFVLTLLLVGSTPLLWSRSPGSRPNKFLQLAVLSTALLFVPSLLYWRMLDAGFLFCFATEQDNTTLWARQPSCTH